MPEAEEQMCLRETRRAEADEAAVRLGIAYRSQQFGVCFWDGSGKDFRAGYWAGVEAMGQAVAAMHTAPLVQIEATPELTALLETSAKTGMTLVTKDEHPWAAYLNARKVAIHHYHAEGRSFDDIAAVLNLADSAHVERIYNATSAKGEPHGQSSKG